MAGMGMTDRDGATHSSGAHSPGSHGGLMDAIYRNQRHIYDATRKYYLLGRDRLIAGLDAPDEAKVLEAACGTGRNLVVAAGALPEGAVLRF